MAFIIGAPMGIVIFLIGVGAILFQVQRSARNMEKLPPLPPKEEDKGWQDGFSLPKQESAPDLPNPLQEHTWGRDSSDDKKPEDNVIERPQPLPHYQPPPAPAEYPIKQAENLTDKSIASAHQSPGALQLSQAAAIAAKSSLTAPRVNSRQRHQGIDFSNPSALRQAVIAMTVLGPCRAIEPYGSNAQKIPLDKPRADTRDQS